MQIYLFAANLLALIAFLLGLGNFAKGAQGWRLLPLFLLVVSQSLSLILYLAGSGGESSAATGSILAALGVFTIFCLVWALVRPHNLTLLWRRLAWGAGIAGAGLAGLLLIPGWPVPAPLHGLTIAMFGALFVLLSLERISWSHLAAPLLLVGANFVGLFEFISLAWLLTLLAYGLLIAALYQESLQKYQARQHASTEMAQEAVYLSQERQRLIEVSEIISAVPGLEQAMSHLARTMAHVTHSDQAVIFTLDVEVKDRVRLAAIYSPERPVKLTSYDEISFNVADCPPLEMALLRQKQQLLSPFQSFQSSQSSQLTQPQLNNHLDSLYGLWNENRVGPTLIQPLLVQGRPIGALVLGNPVTRRPFRDEDVALCRSLASQMAVMVEAFRRYLDLELRADIGEPLSPAPQTAGRPAWEMAPGMGPALELTSGSSGGAGSGSPAAGAMSGPLPEPSRSRLAQAQSADEAAVMASQPDDRPTDYLAILETVEEGVVVANAAGRVALVNRAAERILGKSRQELLNQPISAIYGAISSDETIDDLAAAFSRRDEPLPTFIETKDEARERVIQGQLVPWRNQDREWVGIIAIFNDVTYKVKADQTRTNFVMALSRVLRGPLTLIKGYAELTTSGLPEEYSPEQLQVQRIIHSSVEQVVAILDHAIQVSTENKNKLLPRFEDVDVEKLIDEVLHETMALAELREVRLRREIKEELPVIMADRGQLYRILENLLSNACRFTPPGGRVIVRAWTERVIEGNLSRPELRIAVVDTGVGIPQQAYKRIFEPFYQLDNLQPGDERGMGMGLTVVKELVEMHQGRVWVESVVGKGSMFQVALPVTQGSGYLL